MGRGIIEAKANWQETNSSFQMVKFYYRILEWLAKIRGQNMSK